MGMYLTYCIEASTVENRRTTTKFITKCTLIALAPVSYTNNENFNSDFKEAVHLNAESCIKFFGEIFESYGQNILKWVICFIGDNAPVNLRITRLCGNSHIGFAGHKLNLEDNYMFNRHSELKNIKDDVLFALWKPKRSRKMLRFR